MNEQVIIAVGECGWIHGVSVDDPAHIADTAKFVRSFQRSKKRKYAIKRITLEEFRAGPAMCFCDQKKGKAESK